MKRTIMMLATVAIALYPQSSDAQQSHFEFLAGGNYTIKRTVYENDDSYESNRYGTYNAFARADFRSPFRTVNHLEWSVGLKYTYSLFTSNSILNTDLTILGYPKNINKQNHQLGLPLTLHYQMSPKWSLNGGVQANLSLLNRLRGDESIFNTYHTVTYEPFYSTSVFLGVKKQLNILDNLFLTANYQYRQYRSNSLENSMAKYKDHTIALGLEYKLHL